MPANDLLADLHANLLHPNIRAHDDQPHRAIRLIGIHFPDPRNGAITAGGARRAAANWLQHFCATLVVEANIAELTSRLGLGLNRECGRAAWKYTVGFGLHGDAGLVRCRGRRHRITCRTDDDRPAAWARRIGRRVGGRGGQRRDRRDHSGRG